MNSEVTNETCKEPKAPEEAFGVVSNQWATQAAQAVETVAQLQDQLLRLRADFDNYRKRQQKEREEAIRFANEGLLQDLLPVLDNFELGMKATDTAQDAKSIAMGLKMVLTQFQRLLTDVGVKTIDATGQAFDPNIHEAVGQCPTTDVPEGTVVEQHRKGYKMHDRLLRPASVIVAQAPAEKAHKN